MSVEGHDPAYQARPAQSGTLLVDLWEVSYVSRSEDRSNASMPAPGKNSDLHDNVPGRCGTVGMGFAFPTCI